jgi:hypothetical protein
VDAVRAFSPLVKIANGAKDWERALVEALSENAPQVRQARRARAQESGWDELARQWSSWIEELSFRVRPGVKS